MGGDGRRAGKADEERRERILSAAQDAERVIVSASNGLDMAEGLNIFRPDAHFMQAYGDFAQAYGVSSVLQGLVARWPSEEAHWAFIARVAMTEWLGYEPSTVMQRVRGLVAGKDTYVVTCNFDGRFVRARFPEERVLETEGSLRHLVCSRGCTDELYSAEDTYRQLAAATQDLRVPTELLPRCPHCGAPLAPNIREDRAWQPDVAYARQRTEFDGWLAQAHGSRLLVLELGIGARNQAIKRPLMELVAREPLATYVTFNYSEVYVPPEIASKSIGVPGDLARTLP